MLQKVPASNSPASTRSRRYRMARSYPRMTAPVLPSHAGSVPEAAATSDLANRLAPDEEAMCTPFQAYLKLKQYRLGP